MTTLPPPAARPSWLSRIRASDFWWSFSHSWTARISAGMLVVLIASAFLAPWIAPQNPYDAAQLDLWNSELPPIWEQGGQWPYLLGTDTQARDMLSAILYGTRISVIIGFASVLCSLAIGLSFGLVAGYFGGFADGLLMRLSIKRLDMFSRWTVEITGSMPHAMRNVRRALSSWAVSAAHRRPGGRVASSGTAMGALPHCPGVILNAGGPPQLSTTAWTFVDLSPRERPMGPGHGIVNHVGIPLTRLHQGVEQSPPNTARRPAMEAVAECRWRTVAGKAVRRQLKCST